jgi:hypothetical protein
VIGKSFDESVQPIRNTTQALVSEFTPYLMDRSIGRGASDWFIADLTTGARTPLKANVAGNVAISTGGKYAIYADGGHYWTIDVATKAVTNITKNLKTTFVDLESDSTSPVKTMFGVAGWTKDDESVLLNDRFDIWKVSPKGDGGIPDHEGRNGTGAPRILNLSGQFGDPVDPNGAFVTLFGTQTKKSGYARISADGGSGCSTACFSTRA